MDELEYKKKVEETISAYNVKEKEARSGCYWTCKALTDGWVSVSRYMDTETREIAGLKEGLMFSSPHPSWEQTLTWLQGIIKNQVGAVPLELKTWREEHGEA